MFFPKIKLPKTNWQLWAGLITVVLIAIGGLQTCRANRWEREALRLDGKLAEQQADQDKLYGEAAQERAERNLEREAEKKKRTELEVSIKKAQKASWQAKRALEAEKAKTATLPPTELVAQITERIGDEITLTVARLYLFTRIGTERTLDRFQDGEFYLTEYNRHLGEIKDFKAQVVSFTKDLKSCDEERVESLEGWDDCRETLATAQKDITTWKKVGKASVWKGRKQGAIAILIIASGLKLAGVW